jgi:uncharacterized membrane protein
MTELNETRPARTWLPQLKSKWWTALLGLSLMANLLVGGVMLGGFFGKHRMERLAGVSYIQLIPRNFFRELPKERRQQLMQIVKDNRDTLRDLRENSEASGLKLAEALEQPTFSIEDVKKTVLAFTTGTESLAARGGDVVVQIVAQLTPEERKVLAQTIRERDTRGIRRKKN